MPRLNLARNYALLLATLTACTLRPPPGESGESSGTDGAGTTSSNEPTTTTTPEPTTNIDTDACGFAGCDTTFASTTADPVTTDPTTFTSTSDASTGDIPVPDDCPGYKQLDPDCPDGFKCTIDGGLGDTQCAQVVPRPKQLNEPCTVTDDAFSGIDDCDLGLLCWDVDDQGHGTCIGLCNEDNGEFTCQDPAATCTGLTCQSCLVSLCLVPCNPLLAQCGPGEACIPNDNTFLCTPVQDPEQGQLHDPCAFVNACNDGLTCIEATSAPADCKDQDNGCCEPFCDLDKPACPSPEQTCTPWFEQDPPPNFKNLGICAVL